MAEKLLTWAASLFLSKKKGIIEKPGTGSFLALQKHLEALLFITSSIALCGWSSTQKTRKNSIYNIHIYKYIMYTHSLRHTDTYSQENKNRL